MDNLGALCVGMFLTDYDVWKPWDGIVSKQKSRNVMDEEETKNISQEKHWRYATGRENL